MTQPTILISGAGVAGPALAHWSSANGYRVVVVEVAPAIRPGGQTVDLRGAGRGVVERMGLLDQMADRSMRQRGIAWVRSDGSRRAEMPVEAFDGNGVVSKLEILRGDLVDVLYQHTKDRVEYRFDTRIAALEQTDDAVGVTLTDGTTLLADLVVGADGPHSAVRRMVFGPEEQFVKPLHTMRQSARLAWRSARSPWPTTDGISNSNGSCWPTGSPASAGMPPNWSVRQPKPTTSTSTPSPRCTWRRGRRAA
jgi:2-polyprenyl-6-methoxyphenol hydroxylase-like FAD-dependent oxidoreductase